MKPPAIVRYLTRWALTSGIRKVRGHYIPSRDDSDPGYFCGLDGTFVRSDQAFATLQEAEQAARIMVDLEIQRLRQQRLSLKEKILALKVWKPVVHDRTSLD